ncbi:quinone oxidoreductase [Paecilomyces variotii No. 5]|uniref:Quinone oxidoreductase n=1 Tax=Byssochlamys spectabilis (strain No. 5 / NBRC 109023) TaxID=1356009 RepID=V5I3H3_BYSSN|nr:quinone oxidoreductase [Paecilomyces variotii No. 5]
MKAIGVEDYGSVDNLVPKLIPDPSGPDGRDLLVRIEACSVNPVDTKVRAGKYDDYPDYYVNVPRPFQICGFDAAGTVIAVGPDCELFKKGDDVYYSGSPIRQGSNAEYQVVDERSVGHKPQNLDWTQAAVMPLTYITAWEALVERLEIRKGEPAALLIINGAGGVGSVSIQIARRVLHLPVVIATASRPSTTEWVKKMGATHVINHKEDLEKQINALGLNVPLRYIFITHTTDQYMEVCGRIAAPFGKVCSIVQGQALMYGTKFMAKSLSFIWCLLGTKPYYQVDVESHYKILEELTDLIESGKIKCHLTRRLRLTLEGLREGHRLIEEGGVIGKIGLGVNEHGTGEAFA